jgi:hypothetical protein
MPDYLTLWSDKRVTWRRFFDPAVAATQPAQQTLMLYMLINETDVPH